MMDWSRYDGIRPGRITPWLSAKFSMNVLTVCLVSNSLEIHTLFYSQKKFNSHNKKNLEREYGGGSMFEFRAKMTVVKKRANKRPAFYNPL